MVTNWKLVFVGPCAAPLDLTGAPKLECLSLKERELCGALRLYPQQVSTQHFKALLKKAVHSSPYTPLSLSLRTMRVQYVLIKETLIRESLRHGGQMPKALARKLIKIGTATFAPFFNSRLPHPQAHCR